MEKSLKQERKVRLWTKNFFLLWQGQLVSVLGDVIYTFALDFWILEVTHSTAIMGILSAVTMVPRVILGPIAGVFVDRWDRRKIMVITDFLRGIFVTFVGIAAIMGFIQVWMVFVVGITSSICSAFFNPTIGSVKPDIVPEEVLVKANSATGISDSCANVFGQVLGAVIYASIGAPFMFLFNGISYLFSAFTEVFIKIPKIERKKDKINFKEDFKEGFKFLWNFKALRNIFIVSSLLNFFFNCALILIPAYFKMEPSLGTDRYGYAMAISSCGMITGSVLLSIINIKPKHKYLIEMITGIFMCVAFLVAPVVNNYIILIIAMFLGMFFNVIFNTIFNSTLMTLVPAQKRGKVLSLIMTISMGLAPIGSCLGGVIGQVFGVRKTIIVFFALTVLVMPLMALISGIKDVMNYTSEDYTIDELINKTNSKKKIVA